MRYLVVNADDFGFTRDVNAGIVQAHTEGILTSTTLMATGTAFEDAVQLARQHPTLDIGVHLQMVQGPSISRPKRELPPTLAKLIQQHVAGRWDVLAEFSAQVERILATGIRPTHLDTHKHTHLIPSILEAVAQVSDKYGIRWIRKPFDLPLDPRRAGWKTRAAAIAMRGLRSHFNSVLARSHAKSTDHFAGFAWTGDYTAEDLIGLIRNLPDGTTEFMCHPAQLGYELMAATTRLKESRQRELRALIDPRLKQTLAECGVILSDYQNLPG